MVLSYRCERLRLHLRQRRDDFSFADERLPCVHHDRVVNQDHVASLPRHVKRDFICNRGRLANSIGIQLRTVAVLNRFGRIVACIRDLAKTT